MNNIRVMVTDTSTTSRAHIEGWKAIFGDAVVPAVMASKEGVIQFSQLAFQASHLQDRHPQPCQSAFMCLS